MSQSLESDCVSVYLRRTWFDSRHVRYTIYQQIHPEKKNISNPASVLFLVKNLVSQKQKSENNEQKIVVVRVLVLLKKFYHARRKNGKCKSINQSISQLVACREKDAIYSVFGSH